MIKKEEMIAVFIAQAKPALDELLDAMYGNLEALEWMKCCANCGHVMPGLTGCELVQTPEFKAQNVDAYFFRVVHVHKCPHWELKQPPEGWNTP